MAFNWLKELIQKDPIKSARRLIEKIIEKGLLLERNRIIITQILQTKNSPNLSEKEAQLFKEKVLTPWKKYIEQLRKLRAKTTPLLPQEDNPLQKDLSETLIRITETLKKKDIEFSRSQTITILTQLQKYLQEKQNNLRRARELLTITSEKTISHTQLKRTIQIEKKIETPAITTKINETIQLGITLIPKIKTLTRKWKWTRGDKSDLLEEIKRDLFPQLSLYLQSILEIDALLKKDNYPFENPIKSEASIRETIQKLSAQQIKAVTSKSQEKKIEQLLLLLLANCREKQRHLKTIKKRIKLLELTTEETILAPVKKAA